MTDLDDIPGLDDMTSYVEGIKSKTQSKIQSSLDITESVHKKDQSISKTDATNSSGDICKTGQKSTTKGNKEFGGMMKGFLSKGSSISKTNNNSQSSSLKQSEPIVVSPKFQSDQKDHLVIDEVQEAMKSNFVTDKSWLTEDLLKKISSNEKLSRQLSDPQISSAVTWMQKDPKAAMEYYKNDTEIQTFFKDFYGILGNHFENLGARQNDSENPGTKMSPEDEKKMQKILSNPEIKEIFSKPAIQNLIQQLRTNPDEAQRMLNSFDRGLRADVNKLVSAGVLAFQPQ